MPAGQPQETIWVVVRIDHFGEPLTAESISERITLKEALPTVEEAEAEVARLNQLRKNKGSTGITYFAAPARWFPEGRNVEVGY